MTIHRISQETAIQDDPLFIWIPSVDTYL